VLSDIKQKIKKIVRPLYLPITRILYRTGHITWPTKSYEIWLFIQFLLFKSRPKVIVELGSGRSTHYFSEYCQKKGSSLLSIEQNKSYLRKNKVGLKSSFIKAEGLYHIPIKEDWFDVEKLNQIIADNRIDFILVDAPGGGGGGVRNSSIGNAFLKKITRQSSVIVIDDFHRNEVKRSVSVFLSDRKSKYTSFLLSYNVSDNQQNEILFLVKPELSQSCVNFISLFELEHISLEFSWSSLEDLRM